ncbi:RasGAP C-terminus-domain-containing protein [Suillus lakei]|nr:RasGAP C-terminus-domain-containing protein [Suillus lakei]KAG1725216.1 RasGAP C-terminus-domain-containing protein [Suillus lakei]
MSKSYTRFIDPNTTSSMLTFHAAILSTHNTYYMPRQAIVSDSYGCGCRLKENFPGVLDEVYAACIGKLVYFRYLNTAILSPENFDMVASVDIATRKNLAQISKTSWWVHSNSETSPRLRNYFKSPDGQDAVRVILHELDGAPHLDNDELKDAKDRAVTLELMNRFARVRGKITRNDGFQGILNAIASYVRSRHSKRLQRQQEMDSVVDALKHLSERKKYFEEQIDSYHNYVKAVMVTIQRDKCGKDSLCSCPTVR